MKIKKAIFLIFKKGVKIISGHSLTRFYPIEVVYRFLLSHLRDSNSPIDVLDHKMFLDPIDTLGLSLRGYYEQYETEIVKGEIKKGDVVLDLGANIGYYTLIFAKLVGESGKVFAFEPEPANFSLLKKNMEINGYNNIILIQKAVSDRDKIIKLYLHKYNKGAHTIYKSYDNQEFVEIKTVKPDDYFENYNGKIDFIKMDIEGSEGLALQGMSKILEKNKNIKIFTEFNPSLLKNCGTEPENYLNLLIQQGFKLYHINEEENKLNFITADELMRKYQDGGYTNLLCLR